jgi:hypothetical protein
MLRMILPFAGQRGEHGQAIVIIGRVAQLPRETGTLVEAEDSGDHFRGPVSCRLLTGGALGRRVDAEFRRGRCEEVPGLSDLGTRQAGEKTQGGAVDSANERIDGEVRQILGRLSADTETDQCKTKRVHVPMTASARVAASPACSSRSVTTLARAVAGFRIRFRRDENVYFLLRTVGDVAHRVQVAVRVHDVGEAGRVRAGCGEPAR